MISTNIRLLCLTGIFACILTTVDAREAIDGGVAVTRVNQFSYQVSVRVHGHSHTCGGALVNDMHVITAAHCIVHNSQIVNSSVTILAGTDNLRRTDPSAVIAQVHKIYVPWNYFHSTHNEVIDDIAVLKLLRVISLSHFGVILNWTVQIAKPERNETGKEALIAGWGRGQHQLRYAEERVLSHRQCQELHPHRTFVEQVTLCAKVIHEINPGVRGVCYGDEGGPLVIDDFVIGILSKVAPDCDETTSSAIYTRVSHYILFIGNAIFDGKLPGVRTQVLPTH